MNDDGAKIGLELEVPVDEARLARGWEGVEARAFATPRRSRARVLGAGALAAAAVLAIAYVALRPGESRGPLSAGADSLEAAMPRAAAAGESLALSDGSSVRFARGADVSALENTGERVSMLVRRGRVRFDVRPGGPRRWIVEAGVATVEVVGTAFVVDRRDDGVEVSVERGRVLVRGEGVLDRVRALGAGESVFVPAAPDTPDRPEPIAPPATAEATIDPPPAEPTPTPTPVATAAPVAAPSRPVAAVAPRTAAGLLASADEARRAGRIDEALAQLRAAAARAGDPDAAVASFTRGRLALEHGRAAEAVTDLERALALGVPPSIAESARARLVEAHARAGHPDRARAAADDYLSRYPDGTFRQQVERTRP